MNKDFRDFGYTLGISRGENTALTENLSSPLAEE